MKIAEFASWLGNTAKAAAESLVGDVSGTADEDQGLCDLQLGTRVYNDVPIKMRTELWLSQLHRDKGRGSHAANQYTQLLSAPLSPDLIAEIEKDTHRTFPGHHKLAKRSGQRSLANVLRAYAASDPEIGYTQGMNFVAGLLLAYLDEATAFGALTMVMRDRGLREMYSPDMALLQVRLWQLGRLMPPDVAVHLENHGVLPVLFASSWFLTLFAGDFPMSIAARLMDLVIADSYAAPLMKMAVHILERCRPELLKMTDMEDIVQYLRQTVPSWPRSKLQDLVTEALAKPWTPRQAAILTQINGAESVADAVARVDQAAKTRHDAGGDAATSPSAAATSNSAPVSSSNSSSQPSTGRSNPNKPSRPPTLVMPPPPGSIRVERWRPTTPAISLVSRDSARIKLNIGEVDLDPGLSRELWKYSHDHNHNLSGPTTPEGPALDTATAVAVSTAPSISLALAEGSPPAPASPFDADVDSLASGSGRVSRAEGPTAMTTSVATAAAAAQAANHSRLISSDFGSFQLAQAVDAKSTAGHQPQAGTAGGGQMADLIDLQTLNLQNDAGYYVGLSNASTEEFGNWSSAPSAEVAVAPIESAMSGLNSQVTLLQRDSAKHVPGRVHKLDGIAEK